MMSRHIYMEELEQEARRKAREARLTAIAASGSKEGGLNTSNDHLSFEDVLMEVLEQGKAAIKRIQVGSKCRIPKCC